jgi:hypothetical protein
MVRQTWYQRQGTRSISPPPKKAIPGDPGKSRQNQLGVSRRWLMTVGFGENLTKFQIKFYHQFPLSTKGIFSIIFGRSKAPVDGGFG